MNSAAAAFKRGGSRPASVNRAGAVADELVELTLDFRDIAQILGGDSLLERAGFRIGIGHKAAHAFKGFSLSSGLFLELGFDLLPFRLG